MPDGATIVPVQNRSLSKANVVNSQKCSRGYFREDASHYWFDCNMHTETRRAILPDLGKRENNPNSLFYGNQQINDIEKVQHTLKIRTLSIDQFLSPSFSPVFLTKSFNLIFNELMYSSHPHLSAFHTH